MKSQELLPTFLFALFSGWFLRSFYETPSLPAATVFGAVVAVGVAWLIQRALRRQAELEKVPIESVSRLTSHVDDLVVACLDAAERGDPRDPKLLTSTRLLSNEIEWLCTVVDALDPDSLSRSQMLDAFLPFKACLTGGREIDEVGAARAGRSIRALCLQLRWNVCQRIVARPCDINLLVASAQSNSPAQSVSPPARVVKSTKDGKSSL